MALNFKDFKLQEPSVKSQVLKLEFGTTLELEKKMEEWKFCKVKNCDTATWYIARKEKPGYFLIRRSKDNRYWEVSAFDGMPEGPDSIPVIPDDSCKLIDLKHLGQQYLRRMSWANKELAEIGQLEEISDYK
jgi:hypothetical protein